MGVMAGQHGQVAGSRFVTDTEIRYSVSELEYIAVSAFSFHRIDHFLIVYDHNLLVPILNCHRLDEIENHISGLTSCTTISGLCGTINEATDSLSVFVTDTESRYSVIQFE